MKKRLLIAGAGHAHMVTLANLNRFVEKGYDVTVVGPSEFHYYSGMGPGMLGGTYAPEEIRFATRLVVEKNGGRFVRDKIVRIDPGAQCVHLASGETLPYDVLSCNLGSQVQREIVSGELDDIFLVKPIERLMAARERILSAGVERELTVGIVGGGPSAVEIAGNIRQLEAVGALRPMRIKLLTNTTVMPHHPQRVRQKALASLKRRRIEIVENAHVRQIRTGMVVEGSGDTHVLDIIFVATGVRPSRVFTDSDLPVGPDGGLRVNSYLQSTRYENIFGGGDCIHFEAAPLDKVGVYAVRQNPVLYQNLMATLEGGPLQPFDPGGRYLLIFNLGGGIGILHKWRLMFGGRLAFKVKDYIDRKFMVRFQSLEK